jgi:hypothetical protein
VPALIDEIETTNTDSRAAEEERAHRKGRLLERTIAARQREYNDV